MIDALTRIKLTELLTDVTISYLEYTDVCLKSKPDHQEIESAYSEAYATKQRMIAYINSLEGAGNE